MSSGANSMVLLVSQLPRCAASSRLYFTAHGSRIHTPGAACAAMPHTQTRSRIHELLCICGIMATAIRTRGLFLSSTSPLQRSRPLLKTRRGERRCWKASVSTPVVVSLRLAERSHVLPQVCMLKSQSSPVLDSCPVLASIPRALDRPRITHAAPSRPHTRGHCGV